MPQPFFARKPARRAPGRDGFVISMLRFVTVSGNPDCSLDEET